MMMLQQQVRFFLSGLMVVALFFWAWVVKNHDSLLCALACPKMAAVASRSRAAGIYVRAFVFSSQMCLACRSSCKTSLPAGFE
jgi:hypothetical protein